MPALSSDSKQAWCGCVSLQHVVFGRVLEGLDVIKAVEKTPTAARDRPITEVVIENCGELPPKPKGDSSGSGKRKVSDDSDSESSDSEESRRRRKRERREKKAARKEAKKVGRTNSQLRPRSVRSLIRSVSCA